MTAETTLAIDPHVHTRHSYDSEAAVADVVDHAVRVGLDGLVVTDHDVIEGSQHAAELARARGLFATTGVEVSTADGHLLALGVEDCPPPDRPLSATVERVRDAGGLAVVPHPFRRTSHGVRRRRLGEPDAVETFNACTLLNYRNRQAAAYAESNGLPAVGASDAHVAAGVGRGYTTVRLEDDRPPALLDDDAVFDAIRSGRTDAHGRRASVRRYVNKYAVNVNRYATSTLPRAVQR